MSISILGGFTGLLLDRNINSTIYDDRIIDNIYMIGFLYY
jgi:hypothetical protein